jgi:ATP-binding cassette subfamily B protein
MRFGFNLIRQRNAMDCGPSCFAMVAKFYGRRIELADVNNKTNLNRD